MLCQGEACLAQQQLWLCRTMAQAAGVSPATAQRVWAGRGLKPRLVETFKLSADPRFEEKLADVAGLRVSPPERAVALRVNEKTQVQALSRTQPVAPVRVVYGVPVSVSFRNG